MQGGADHLPRSGSAPGAKVLTAHPARVCAGVGSDGSQVMTGFFGMNFETFEVLKWEHGLPFFCLVGAGATLLTRWW